MQCCGCGIECSMNLCAQCRADLELGRVVRAMPPDTELAHTLTGSWRFTPSFLDNVEKAIRRERTPDLAMGLDEREA